MKWQVASNLEVRISLLWGMVVLFLLVICMIVSFVLVLEVDLSTSIKRWEFAMGKNLFSVHALDVFYNWKFESLDYTCGIWRQKLACELEILYQNSYCICCYFIKLFQVEVNVFPFVFKVYHVLSYGDFFSEEDMFTHGQCLSLVNNTNLWSILTNFKSNLKSPIVISVYEISFNLWTYID